MADAFYAEHALVARSLHTNLRASREDPRRRCVIFTPDRGLVTRIHGILDLEGLYLRRGKPLASRRPVVPESIAQERKLECR